MLLLHKPGANPSSLDDDLFSEMAELAKSKFCPVMVKQDFITSMLDMDDPALEPETIEDDDQLLPDPMDRSVPTVQQDDWMQALGGEVLQDNINNQEDNQIELVQDDDHDPITQN